MGLSAFWATVVKVELTDIVFAIDSILVAVAMSQKLWVILAGGLLGIVMMRVVIGRLLSLVSTAARGRRVHHHLLGRGEAVPRPAHGRLRAFRGAELVLLTHRADLRGVVLLRTRARPQRRCADDEARHLD
jgi:hypothetical protein